MVPVPHRTEHGADACVSRESVSSGIPQVPSGPAPGLRAYSSTSGLGPVTRAALKRLTLQQTCKISHVQAELQLNEEPQILRDQAMGALWSSTASSP